MSTGKDYLRVIHGDQGVNKHHSTYCSVIAAAADAVVFIIYITRLLLT